MEQAAGVEGSTPEPAPHGPLPVGSARRVGVALLPICKLAENRREDIGKAFESARAAERIAAAAVLESGFAETVIGGALLRVLEAFVSFADRLELGFLVRASIVAVRMMLLGELAVGGLDRLRVSPALYAKDGVIILFHHLHAPGTHG